MATTFTPRQAITQDELTAWWNEHSGGDPKRIQHTTPIPIKLPNANYDAELAATAAGKLNPENAEFITVDAERWEAPDGAVLVMYRDGTGKMVVHQASTADPAKETPGQSPESRAVAAATAKEKERENEERLVKRFDPKQKREVTGYTNKDWGDYLDKLSDTATAEMTAAVAAKNQTRIAEIQAEQNLIERAKLAETITRNRNLEASEAAKLAQGQTVVGKDGRLVNIRPNPKTGQMEAVDLTPDIKGLPAKARGWQPDLTKPDYGLGARRDQLQSLADAGEMRQDMVAQALEADKALTEIVVTKAKAEQGVTDTARVRTETERAGRQGLAETAWQRAQEDAKPASGVIRAADFRSTGGWLAPDLYKLYMQRMQDAGAYTPPGATPLQGAWQKAVPPPVATAPPPVAASPPPAAGGPAPYFTPQPWIRPPSVAAPPSTLPTFPALPGALPTSAPAPRPTVTVAPRQEYIAPLEDERPRMTPPPPVIPAPSPYGQREEDSIQLEPPAPLGPPVPPPTLIQPPQIPPVTDQSRRSPRVPGRQEGAFSPMQYPAALTTAYYGPTRDSPEATMQALIDAGNDPIAVQMAYENFRRKAMAGSAA